MANQGLLIGGVAVLGVAAYFLTQGGEEPTTLEDTQATSFVGLGGGGEADNRSQKLENPKEFLDDCATPTTTTTDATTDDGTTQQECAVPLYLANETITLEHPLAATNSDFARYTFTVRIEADILTSMTEAAFNAAPASEVLGDYTISLSKSGSFGNDRWTANQNPDFNGSLTETGLITKGNANDPASSVVPTWEQCLAAYGGYMPNKVGGLGDEVIFRQGDFDDVGEFRYLKKSSDGQDYPTTANKFALDMSGNVIPLYAQMEIKCGGSSSWNAVGGLTQVTSANLLVGDDACYAPCYPAVLPTSGVALGCSLPTVNITYPSVIHVVCDDDVEDCSDRATSSAGGIVQDEVWNLNPAAPQQSTMQKGKWTTKSGAVHGIVFDNLRTPRVYQDSSGRWYVRYSNSPTGNVYIDEVIPTFKATYTRQSVTCTCPSDTNLEGTTFTLLDKYSCPAGTPEASMFAGVLGGSDEWKTTYCGGLKPVYGCKDTRATNYNSNPDVVKDPTDNDVCNPKYCNYASNVILPECQGSGDLGGGGLDVGGGETTNPGGNTGGTDLSPSDSTDDCPQCAGKTGQQLLICKAVNCSGKSNIGSGGGSGGFTGGVNLMAENIISPAKLVNSAHSFLNW